VGIGYRCYVEDSQLDYLSIAPNSRLEYRLILPDARVQILFFEALGTTVDPTSRPDISLVGTNASEGSIFRNLNSTSGLDVEWQPTRASRVTAGYSFTLDRSLSEDFTYYDSDVHSIRLGGDYTVSSAWNVGVQGIYGITEHVENLLNNGGTYTIGPQVNFVPFRALSVFGTVGYTAYDFDSSGTTSDTSDFSGPTFRAGLRHTLSRAVTHSLQADRRVDASFYLGSNYTDIWSVQYEINTTLTRRLKGAGRLIYENYSVSEPGGDQGNQYVVQLTTGYELARRWNLGLVYSFVIRDASQTVLDYTQNRVNLQVTHRF